MNNKLTSKDLINIGIFTAIIYALSLVVAFVGITPLSSLFAGPLYALLAAPIYMLYIAKVHKPFAVIITGLFCSVMCLVSFTSVLMALLSLVAFVASELIAKSGKYLSYKLNTISYLVFTLWTLVINGGYWYLQDFMVEFSLSSGMDQTWLDQMVEIATPLNLVLVIVGTLLCAFIGSLYAKVMLKKHFTKAGII